MASYPSKANSGIAGFLLAASLAMTFCAVLGVIVLPAGLAFFLFWTLPSLIHARVNITRQERYLPLPWEDQFAAVIVSFILQIPLWLTSGFVGFLFGALIFDLLGLGSFPAQGGWPLGVSVYFLVWLLVSVVVYLVLFIVMLLWSIGSVYPSEPTSQSVSIRDAKPIYHPF